MFLIFLLLFSSILYSTVNLVIFCYLLSFYAALLAAYTLPMISLSRNIHTVSQYMRIQERKMYCFILYMSSIFVKVGKIYSVWQYHIFYSFRALDVSLI